MCQRNECSRARGDRPQAPADAGAAIIVCSMAETPHFTADQARAAGERIGIDWNASRFDVEQFRMGMDVELEHGTRDPDTDVTNDDVDTTAKIARAHLNEFPDYYTRLARMESDAESYWESQGE
jgi:Protein of unknown function (DUF5661)